MFQHRIVLKEGSDPASVLLDLRDRAGAALGAEQDAVLNSAQQIVGDFMTHGGRIAAVGSVFQASRDLVGTDYKISIVAQFGVRPPLWKRLLGIK